MLTRLAAVKLQLANVTAFQTLRDCPVTNARIDFGILEPIKVALHVIVTVLVLGRLFAIRLQVSVTVCLVITE